MPARGIDGGWLARRLLADLAAASADDHRTIYRVTAALPVEAHERLGRALAEGAAVPAAAPAAPPAVAAIDALLAEGQCDHAIALAEVVLRDHLERFGADAAATELAALALVRARREHDERTLARLVEGNDELFTLLRARLGRHHRATLAAQGHLDALRAQWGRWRRRGR